jgi:hypothetical protein
VAHRKRSRQSANKKAGENESGPTKTESQPKVRVGESSSDLLSEQHAHAVRRHISDIHVIGAVMASIALGFLAVVLYDDSNVLKDLAAFAATDVPVAGFYVAIASGVVLIGYQAYRLEYLPPIVIIGTAFMLTSLLVLLTAFHPPRHRVLPIGSIDLMPWLFELMTLAMVGAWFYLEARLIWGRDFIVGLVLSGVCIAIIAVGIWAYFGGVAPPWLVDVLGVAIGVLVLGGLAWQTALRLRSELRSERRNF